MVRFTTRVTFSMSHVTRNSSNASSTSALHERGSPSGPPDPEAPRLGWWEIAPATSPSSRLRFGRVFEFEGDSKSSITIIGRNPISTSTCGQVSSGTGVQHPCSCFAQVHRVVPLRVNNNDFSPCTSQDGRFPPNNNAMLRSSSNSFSVIEKWQVAHDQAPAHGDIGSCAGPILTGSQCIR